MLGFSCSLLDLITNMAVHTSVTMFHVVIAFHLLSLIFPFWIFCVLLFLRACCCVLSQSASATAGALHRRGRRGCHTGQGRSWQQGHRPVPPPQPRCRGTRGQQAAGVTERVPVQGPENWLGCLLAPAAALPFVALLLVLMAKKRRYFES